MYFAYNSNNQYQVIWFTYPKTHFIQIVFINYLRQIYDEEKGEEEYEKVRV